MANVLGRGEEILRGERESQRDTPAASVQRGPVCIKRIYNIYTHTYIQDTFFWFGAFSTTCPPRCPPSGPGPGKWKEMISTRAQEERARGRGRGSREPRDGLCSSQFDLSFCLPSPTCPAPCGLVPCPPPPPPAPARLPSPASPRPPQCFGIVTCYMAGGPLLWNGLRARQEPRAA